jgi:hypothetical protein
MNAEDHKGRLMRRRVLIKKRLRCRRSATRKAARQTADATAHFQLPGQLSSWPAFLTNYSGWEPGNGYSRSFLRSLLAAAV